MPFWFSLKQQDRCYIYHKSLCVAASHTLLSILRKSSTLPIANFLPVLPNLVTVYIIFFLPKPLDNCPYSLRKRQHSHQLPRIEFSHSAKQFVYLNSDDWLDFIFSLFFVSPCVLIVVCYDFNVYFCNCFLIYCNSVRMSHCIKRLLDLTWLDLTWAPRGEGVTASFSDFVSVWPIAKKTNRLKFCRIVQTAGRAAPRSGDAT